MAKTKRPRSARVSTGILGLDTILNGGFFRGGVYLVRGAPGAGKTILANQVCFSQARAGHRAIYVTLLAESHARMMLHLESLSFFDPSLVSGRVQYFSGYNTLETDGLRGVMELLRRELRSQKASVLVVDGLVALRESTASALELKKFIHELQLHADLVGCAVLLLTGPAESGIHPENTMVDGILELTGEIAALRSVREIFVHKFRGDGYLRGGHPFDITPDGLRVYPRIESMYGRPSPRESFGHAKVSTGVRQLDLMMGGGIQRGSTTMILGPSGAGKTTLGLHYLANGGPREKCLHFGFYETPDRLLLKARSLGLDLDQKVRRGQLELLWQPSTETGVDALLHMLLDTLNRHGATRLFIDGLDGLQRATVHEQRVHHVFTALANELRQRGVTTLYTFESQQFLGPTLQAPLHGISTLVENLILLRFVELRSQLYRLLSLMKVRDSSYDSSIREFGIGPRGISLRDTFERAGAILSGTAVPTLQPPRGKRRPIK